MTQQVQAYRATFTQVLASCDTVIPSPVAEAFALVDSRLKRQLRNNPKLFEIRDEEGGSLVYLEAYNELYSEISNSCLWPWIPLKPHDAANRAIHKVEIKKPDNQQSLPEIPNLWQRLFNSRQFAHISSNETSS